ncbi:MAG TPA: hypothetical protein PKA42_01025 [Candidatus Paceibacterota bacterium]|nr:hypothetical protein [Candidatus Paceibacterota bacterium]HMO82725.1 hypothetical protein [Candidatus Paceibacterota bacterium]
MKYLITIITIVLLLLVFVITFNQDEKLEVVELEEGKALDSTQESEIEEYSEVAEVEVGDSVTSFDVIVVTNTGERIKIAESDNSETIENYFDIVTYQEAYISPNKKFVALQGSQFEDSFVQIYNTKSGVLHEWQWGRFAEWTPDNLLKVDSCNLAGEDCSYLISETNEKPWEFIERVE